MPLTITVPEREFYDEKSGRFIVIHKTTLQFEHSLLSISKWEAKWHKPYLSKTEKKDYEALDYLRCMCLTKNVDPNVYLAISSKQMQQINEYINNPMTATTIKRRDQKPSREIITNELVYYWMTSLQIPFDPCEKWHFNRLMTLIEVASIKNQPSKKMPKNQAMRERAALNAQRRAKYNTKG